MTILQFTVDCKGLKPVAINCRGKRYHVIQVNGHWRLGGCWWDGEGETWYYRVSTSEGAVADLSYSPNTGQWQVHRFYD